MKYGSNKNSRLTYVAFCIPFVLAFLSWMYFPTLARWVVTSLFNYEISSKTSNIVWYIAVRVFYTWYTFLAIGVVGVWVIAATLARRKHVESKHSFYPNVSFVVPAFNQERNVSRCITSLFKCAENYGGSCEIFVVDDGSSDHTYEVAWSAIKLGHGKQPKVRGRVVMHSVNLGKIEALKTGVGKALGSVIAIVDADSEWMPDTLGKLVDYKLSNGKKAVTGYVHPSAQKPDANFYVNLQQLEYSQGLGIGRCAQSLGDDVLVISGAIGVYDADLLREILNVKNIRTVTEDLEITLEMHRRGAKVGYTSVASSTTVVPTSFKTLWNQRLRWFTGWLQNTLNIYEDLLQRRTWLAMLLWYSYIVEFMGAFVDIVALCAFPFFFWFAPDRSFFVLNLLIFIPYSLFIGIVFQAIALKYAYGRNSRAKLLFYVPLYPLLRLINIFARSRSFVSYLRGSNGKWH